MARIKQIANEQVRTAPRKSINAKTGKVEVVNGLSKTKASKSALRRDVLPKKTRKTTKKSTKTKINGKKPHRYRQNTVALREIRKLQKSTHLVFPNLPFQRLVRDVLNEFGHQDVRIKKEAFTTLQEATEARVIAVVEVALDHMASNGKARTLMLRNLEFGKRHRRVVPVDDE